jgi:arabinogalactan endo-1,4-beta-galactosidase
MRVDPAVAGTTDGPSGFVVAIDLEPELLDDVEKPNIDVRGGDIRDIVLPENFHVYSERHGGIPRVSNVRRREVRLMRRVRLISGARDIGSARKGHGGSSAMRRIWVVLPLTALFLAAPGAALAVVTQPPPPYDPSPLDGDTEYLINQASGLQADARGADVVESVRSFSHLSQRWAMTKLRSGHWKISNVGTGRCLEAAPARRVVLRACRVGVTAQAWSFSYVGNGYSAIANAETRLVLDVGHRGKLTQTAVRGPRTQSQLWEYRPTYFRGNDSSLESKAESDRVFANSVPWWHDAYLPGQDLLQIFKDNGLNMIRVRPASINTTVIHDGVSFPITAAPYNNYTLAPPPASQVIPASANPASPGGTSSGSHAQTDWSAVDLAKRAKQLGMAVNVTLFYSGDNTSETPGNWAGKTVDELAGVPPHAGLMYDYVKQEMELFRANGAWPDLVSIGNEVNNGMFNTTGADGLSPSGTNCTPTATAGGTGTANCFPRIQRAAMQAIADAASDTSDPALLGRPLPPPLTCIHVDGNPDLQAFFDGAVNTNGIPLDVACESYYPGWHGPLTGAQQTWHPCNTFGDCGSTVQHVAQDDFAGEANGLGLPIFTIEDGVSYTTQGSPQDPWYGINPPGPSRALSRQGIIDLNKVEENIPHHLSLGMEWWAGEATPIPGGSSGVRGFWATPGIGLFDASTTAGNPSDNATLPVMAAMGDRLDPTLAYKLVNAADRGVLESTRKSTALDTGPDTGITGPQQQWRLLAQGADPEENSATYPTPMDHRGDGYFQIANMNRANGINVLDTHGTHVTRSPQATDVFAITGTDSNQEWDILPAGNCGDIPANCTAPPTVTNGDGNYYVIVNKATGQVLSASGAGVKAQAPAAPSNGDWIEPANKGQLWRIVPARITRLIPNHQR